MYSPITILSENTKCGHSINLPIKGHCRPTKACAFCCYARTGHTALPAAQHKQMYVSQYLALGELSRLVNECTHLPQIRLNGSGDLNVDHIKPLLSLAEQCPGTQFWGMTRKVEIARTINGAGLSNLNILVSVDATSPSSTWKYDGMLCYGPRRPGDVVPDDRRLVVIFPYHHSGKVVSNVPENSLDCPAVRHKISGCSMCGRCWQW